MDGIEFKLKAVVGISALCMLAFLPDPSSLLSDHVDAALRESAKGKDTVRERVLKKLHMKLWDLKE